MARKSISSALYRAARAARNMEALASGDHRRIARRAKNRFLGRKLGRLWKWP